MNLSQKVIQVKSRLVGLDVTKGVIMIVMAYIHSCFFFSIKALQKPFILFDPFVFPTFLLCFGIGNGLSRRPKQLKALGKLLLVYLIGGLPSTVVAYLLTSQDASLSLIPTIAYKNLVDAITLQGRLPYADFLVPFIVAFAFLLIFQSFFRELNRRTLAIALGFSIISYVIGNVLAQIAPDAVLRDFYASGFRSLQSIPIFITGVYLGLFLQNKGKIPTFKPQTFVWLVLSFLFLLVAAYFVYNQALYNGQFWKKSGELSYLIVSIIVSINLIFVVEGALKTTFVQKHLSVTITRLEKIGQRSMNCLWIQFLLIPIVGYIVSISGLIVPLRFLLSIATVGMICWLTVDDRLPWNLQLQKK